MEKESRRKTRKNRIIQTKIRISLRNISRDCIRSQKDSRINQLIFIIAIFLNFFILKKEKTKFYNGEFISKKILYILIFTQIEKRFLHWLNKIKKLKLIRNKKLLKKQKTGLQ